VRVIGFDPGSRHTGWGVVDCRGAAARAVAWGRLSPPGGSDLGVRLAAIVVGVEHALALHRPDLAAIERVFHGANPRSLIVLAEARGALVAAVGRAGLPLLELAPAAVKSAIAGSGRADKEQVARMIRLALGLAGDAALAPDESDALAVALAAGSSALARAGRRL
jgi:crossover junction endodeoxyribonuclease RuvC